MSKATAWGEGWGGGLGCLGPLGYRVLGALVCGAWGLRSPGWEGSFVVHIGCRESFIDKPKKIV